jgi:hypothetical protein
MYPGRGNFVGRKQVELYLLLFGTMAIACYILWVGRTPGQMQTRRGFFWVDTKPVPERSRERSVVSQKAGGRAFNKEIGCQNASGGVSTYSPGGRDIPGFYAKSGARFSNLDPFVTLGKMPGYLSRAGVFLPSRKGSPVEDTAIKHFIYQEEMISCPIQFIQTP